ncbi:serine/threonine protein kinase, partial [Myxococcota bacterium]|nr:serine/threonine protein kinase [Myxococcota bacterium]
MTEGQIVASGDLPPPPVPRSMIHGETSDAGISFLHRFQPGIVISGRYRLERMIARGGMGCVFLATQLPLGRQVAIKFLTVQEPSKEFRRRFLLEASTCARLVHRHIVTVHDYGETDDGDLYMAMEYLNGEPLSKVITKSVRFPAERACRVALQVCRALRAAHLAGVVHRDLKPSNVMLLEDEDEDAHLGGDFVKVLDFGLVKAMEPSGALAKERAAEKHDLTRAGVLLGSPRYMAPEQIRSEAVTPATDVYSLGVILFHMVAGRPPFVGANSVEILNQHLKDPVPALADVAPDAEPSPELEVVIRRCMEKSPADRYASMEELISDLKAAYRLIAGLSFGSEIAPAELGLDDGPLDVLSALRSPGDGRITGRVPVGALSTPKPGTLTAPPGATSTPAKAAPGAAKPTTPSGPTS